MTDTVKFYFDHSKKINKAVATRKAAADYVVNQFQGLAKKLGLELIGKQEGWRHIREKNNSQDAYYCVYPTRIIRDKELKIALEFRGNKTDHLEEIKKAIKERTQANGVSFTGENNGNRTHQIVVKSYDLEEDDLRNLDEKIIEYVFKDFEPIRKTLNDLAKKKL